MAITLRPITPDDAPFLLAVYAQSRAPEIAQVAWDEAQKQAFLAAQFQAQHQHYQTEYPEATYEVILHDDQPAGRLYVDRRYDEIRILDLAVLPGQDALVRPVLVSVMDEAASALLPVKMYVEVYKKAFLALLFDLGFEQQEDHGVSVLIGWHSADNA